MFFLWNEQFSLSIVKVIVIFLKTTINPHLWYSRVIWCENHSYMLNKVSILGGKMVDIMYIDSPMCAGIYAKFWHALHWRKVTVDSRVGWITVLKSSVLVHRHYLCLEPLDFSQIFICCLRPSYTKYQRLDWENLVWFKSYAYMFAGLSRRQQGGKYVVFN